MAKADRTPKKIAGLKLPKSIREAPAIKALLSTPEGRKLFGEALVEGAAAAAAKVLAAQENLAKREQSPSVRKTKSNSAKPTSSFGTPVPPESTAAADADLSPPAVELPTKPLDHFDGDDLTSGKAGAAD